MALKKVRFIFLYIIVALAAVSMYGQTDTELGEGDRIFLLNADSIVYDYYRTHDAQCLSGHVHFRHQGMDMWADSAVFYRQSNSFSAFRNVRVIQGDTLEMLSDRLAYDGNIQLLKVRENVRLTHRNQLLKTDSLNYDRLLNCGYYYDGGELIDDGMRLVSEEGEYYTQSQIAKFYTFVQLTTDDYEVRTDTLFYNRSTHWAELFGPSVIEHGTDYVTAQHAEYNTEKKRYRLYRRVLQPEVYRGAVLRNEEVVDYDVSLKGDTLLYAKDADFDAFGSIRYEDRQQHAIFKGEEGHYNELTGKGFATGRALVEYFDEGADTLYLHADTLRIVTFDIGTDSVRREVYAYPHVRSYRSDMQAVCDSMVLKSASRKMTLYKDPIVWSDNQQILGEEINVFMNDSTIDSIYVERQALMAERVDSAYFNQVAAEQFRSYFRNGEIARNVADRNVFLVYYPIESDGSLNNSWYLETSQLCLDMKDRQVQRIWTPTAQGKGYPLGKCPREHRILSNFVWFDYIRPLNSDDVFKWREKAKESKLKPQHRHEAPLQHI